jgi:hypothetical protein
MVDTTDTRTPAALHGLHQRAEVAVAGEQHHVVEVRGQLQRVDRQLDVHVALDLATTRRVDELLGRLRHHPVAVVVQPVDQGADGGILLILDERRVVEGANQVAAALEFLQEPLVVDVEAEGLGGGVEVAPSMKRAIRCWPFMGSVRSGNDYEGGTPATERPNLGKPSVRQAEGGGNAGATRKTVCNS